MRMDFPRRAFTVFVCFAQEDQQWYERLDKHLSLLKEQEGMTCWSPLLIPAGMERGDAVAQQCQVADLFLLLISADFLASSKCQEIMRYALQREREGTSVVLPVLLRAVDWQKAPFSHLQMLPKNNLAVASWVSADDAFEEIVRQIRALVEVLRRWVCLSSSPHHQSMLTRLASDLEGYHIPISTHTDQNNLKEAIRLSSAVILLTSQETCFSQMDREVVELAIIEERQLIVLWLPDEELNEPVPQEWRGSICIDARPPRYDFALKALLVQMKCRLSAPLPPVESESDHEPRNPYKGLRPFGMSDVGDFFGRETLVKECLEALQHALQEDQQGALQHGRLLAVIGPSGSGKSSVVMAGLLPNLRKSVLPGSDKWVYLDALVPGTDPVEALTIVLSEHFPEKGLKTIREDLEEDSMRGLHQYATLLTRRQEAAGVQVVLVVDQFEELFTQTLSEEKRRLFLDLLITAITVPRGPLMLILTLRADFSDRVMLYPNLSRLIDAHHCLVHPMEISDLRRVIEQPAALSDVQLRFEGDLVSDLLLEMRGQIGALPLSQFALDQLFQQRDGHLLTSNAYREMGGIRGALAKHAETTFAELPTKEHRKLAQTVFLRLIIPGITEQETTRRRARRSELEVGDSTQTRLLRETADIFVVRRLLTTSEVAGVPTIEVSHEALLQEWPRLTDWVSEARKDLRLQQVLSQDVTEWEQHNRPADRLYRGRHLKEARAWAKRNMSGTNETGETTQKSATSASVIPSASEMAFLRASMRQRIRSVVRLITILLVAVSLISVTGWYGYALSQSPQLANPTRVTTPADDGPGSLRWCINTAPSESTITFHERVRGTIGLTSGDLAFPSNKKLTIDGPGENALAISGSANSAIHILPKASVTISGLSFKKSRIADGGSGNQSLIYNNGFLQLTSVIISGNYTVTGTIYNDSNSTLTVRNSTISGNSAGLRGGGIFNAGKMTVSNSTISGNSVSGDGGGISNDGEMTVSNSTISGNSVSGDGGGISNFGKMTVSNSTISGNSEKGESSLSARSGNGGGIFNSLDGTLTVGNSTISDNSAAGNGGGIANLGGSTHITFCTIYNNRASDSGGILTSDYEIPGGHIFKSEMTMRNSIVAANGPVDASGSFISRGYNLIQKGATFTPATGDKLGADLSYLFAGNVQLSDNGGPTRTLALLPDPRNPALNAIPLASCQIKEIYDEHARMYIDQRGKVRLGRQKVACDIGAYEAQM